MTALRRLAQRISQLRLMAMLGLALGCGLLGGFFGHAPWRILFIFALIVPPLIWMLDGIARDHPRQKLYRGFLLGYFFALGYFNAGLYWIAYSFLVTPLALLAPFGVFGLSLYLAVFLGAAFAASLYVWPQGWPRFLSLAFFWALGEWLRGFVLTGFEWNLAAQSWMVSEALAQNFSWAGIHSATLITIAAAASFAALGEQQNQSALQSAPQSFTAEKIKPPLIALSVFFVLWAGGIWRLSAAGEATPSNQSTAKTPEVIIIQPNIAQRDKWNPRLRDMIIKRYFTMSAQAFKATKNKPQQTIMIWPEAALPVDIERAPSLRAALADLIPENAFLITGLLHFDRNFDGIVRRAFNSIYLITDQGALAQRYDKTHLVPFGEYLPMQPLLESIGLSQITGRRGGYSAGETRALMHHQNSPRLAPLICYEIAFAREVPGTDQRPDGIVNVTNDGWYDLGSGPHQHFDLARLRAIAQGLPVVRAANTGISAIIDPYGRIITQQKLRSQGVIRAPLPAALPPTFYAQWGDWVFIVMLAAIAFALSSRKNIPS